MPPLRARQSGRSRAANTGRGQEDTAWLRLFRGLSAPRPGQVPAFGTTQGKNLENAELVIVQDLTLQEEKRKSNVKVS